MSQITKESEKSTVQLFPIQKPTRGVQKELLILTRNVQNVSWFVLRFYGPSQPNGVMLSVVSLPNHKFTGQA